jgi:hypothetical protein
MLQIMICLVLTAGQGLCASQADQREALAKRARLYYADLSKARYDLMWEMSSRRFKQDNGNDKGAYIKYLQKAGRIKARITINEISIEGKRAIVKLVLSVLLPHEKEWVDEEQNNVWVCEGGRWRFDSQI